MSQPNVTSLQIQNIYIYVQKIAFDKKSITVVEIVFESFHKPPPKQRFRSRTYLRSKSGRKHQRGILTRRVDRVEQSNVF